MAHFSFEAWVVVPTLYIVVSLGESALTTRQEARLGLGQFQHLLFKLDHYAGKTKIQGTRLPCNEAALLRKEITGALVLPYKFNRLKNFIAISCTIKKISCN